MKRKMTIEMPEGDVVIEVEVGDTFRSFRLDAPFLNDVTLSEARLFWDRVHHVGAWFANVWNATEEV